MILYPPDLIPVSWEVPSPHLEQNARLTVHIQQGDKDGRIPHPLPRPALSRPVFITFKPFYHSSPIIFFQHTSIVHNFLVHVHCARTELWRPLPIDLTSRDLLWAGLYFTLAMHAHARKVDNLWLGVPRSWRELIRFQFSCSWKFYSQWSFTVSVASQELPPAEADRSQHRRVYSEFWSPQNIM